MASHLFVTGGSGFVGSVVIEHAIAEGYTVDALSRSESSDETLRRLGAVPVRGDIASLDVLRDKSAAADAVIHLATAFSLGAGTWEDPKSTDIAAQEAMADGLAGSNKPLILTSGTLASAPDPNGEETDESSPILTSPLGHRLETEACGLSLASRGVCTMGVRLAPFTYGRGGSGVKRLIEISAQKGGAAYVDAGGNRTTNVHVDDAARLYLLAVQKGKAGEIYNASSSTTVTLREIVGAVATVVGVLAVSVTSEQAVDQFGPVFTFLISTENRASGAKAMKNLGWQPREKGIVDEILHGSYQPVAAALRK